MYEKYYLEDVYSTGLVLTITLQTLHSSGGVSSGLVEFNEDVLTPVFLFCIFLKQIQLVNRWQDLSSVHEGE